MMLPRRFYFDNALDDFFEEEGAKMKCDIYEKDNKYHVEMDLPGFTKDEIKIECNKGNLIVTAEKEEDEENKDKKYLRRERSYGKYSRSFYLGDIEEDGINAEFSNGTLHITVPKVDENKDKKYIDIK
ncbi:MAG TPA: Hsp20/alpha crystallin family protein [Candidatus Onthousia faecigallinarum]|nr:Hsp20/alpha crystallin family protein [Candidatus Onthousia faecigallinarum]